MYFFECLMENKMCEYLKSHTKNSNLKKPQQLKSAFTKIALVLAVALIMSKACPVHLKL